MADDSTVSDTILSKNELPHVGNQNASLQNYFGVSDGEATDKLDTIREYLRGDRKEYTDMELLRDIKDLEFKLGSAPMNTSQLMHVYTYVKLAGQAKEIEKRLEEMRR